MRATIAIIGVKQDGKDGVLVKFSDGTEEGYVVEELLELRPVRYTRWTDKSEPPKTGPGPIPSN